MAICARCRKRLGNFTGESSIYSPGRAFDLCEPCWDAESDEIDAAGTNDIPERLAEYRNNLRLGARF